MAQLCEEIKPIFMRQCCFFRNFLKKGKKPAILPSNYDFKKFRSKLFLAAYVSVLTTHSRGGNYFAYLLLKLRKNSFSELNLQTNCFEKERK